MSKTELKQVVEDVVFTHFVESLDFNGILASGLQELLEVSEDEFREALHELLEAKRIVLAFDRIQGNPHIIRLEPPSQEIQKELLAEEPLHSFCIYPTAERLRTRHDLSDYENRPFSRRLALGEAQLKPVYFELSVLESYYRDPRYHFRYYDVGGQISVCDEAYFSDEMPERDKVLIETFGIAYDEARRRVLVVFLRYLSNLSPEHQVIWNSQIVERACVMNSDYARSSLYGSWPKHHSIYQALLAEFEEINKLSVLIGKQPLFRNDFSSERPVELHPLLRPTKRNLYEFIQFFDKMLSENIDRAFFDNDIPIEEEIDKGDGRFEIVRKGTLRLLQDWIHIHYRTADGDDVSEEVIAPFKNVRELRQDPAHRISADIYDVTLTAKQDRIVSDVLYGLRKIRYILMSHPLVQDEYRPPDWLDGEDIVIY